MWPCYLICQTKEILSHMKWANPNELANNLKKYIFMADETAIGLSQCILAEERGLNLTVNIKCHVEIPS